MSDAWARTVVQVASEDKQRACHVITRIEDPSYENPRIREMADGILAARRLAPVDAVANTLFPRAMAALTPDPQALAKRYLDLLPTLKRLDHENARGTYFERLVNYETPNGALNQLAELERKLKVELDAAAKSTTGAKTARYEVSFEQLTASLPILKAERDTNPIGFPCLTLLSFQLDGDRLHAIAHYRSHYLFQRAYGNYLAVCRLLCYLCGRVSLAPGQVTIVAAYAQVDKYRKSSVQVLDDYLTMDQLI